VWLTADSNVEAMSNLAATLFAMNRKHDAEQQWRRAVELRPSYFEAVEHLIGLLCGEQRGKEAVEVIKFVERSLRINKSGPSTSGDKDYDLSPSTSASPSLSENSDKPLFDFDGQSLSPNVRALNGQEQPAFGSSGYSIPDAEVGRLLQLIHAKGNMLYAMGDNMGAAKSFEEAVLLGTGRGPWKDINGLIRHILSVISRDISHRTGYRQHSATDPILLAPEEALATHRLCFPPHGDLPGIKASTNEGLARKASISTTSNSLLSLAKIFQDGMASNSPKAAIFQTTYGVREILALYYLSLALQQSPSTANNVGILLASVQQAVPPRPVSMSQPNHLLLSGVAPGSGVALALAYYEYGLRLDNKHAHLYTNLGSLLKDIGHLQQAIRMYENAVSCDQNFDIALANLANAVKDQGRIADAIGYYKRAVDSSPDFAEAVCGLANALNSVCGWAGRGGIAADGGRRDRWHVGEDGMLKDATLSGASSGGWIKRVVDLVDKQLGDGEAWGKGLLDANFVEQVVRTLPTLADGSHDIKEQEKSLALTLKSWSGAKWEGAKMVRLIERIMKRLTWQWYHDKYIRPKSRPIAAYSRPILPPSVTIPAAPTVLPFHTFTCPMSAKQIRNISQRNGLRISCSALRAPWLSMTVHAPPRPPNPYLKVGYVSSDFNNHPLAHLMQSVFGMHDRKKVKSICYATTASDNSVHRLQIEREAPVFHDASNWPTDRLVKQIVEDGIHILVNLNGYTRGARNEVFAARPAPIQMSFMGFAGTLGAEWCDYLLADETAVPRDTLRPWRRNVDVEDVLVDETNGGENEDWIYGENIIYCRDTFFCCDHRQSAPDAKGRQLNWDEELERRWTMRKEIFPNLPDDAIILGNFNQLYKVCYLAINSFFQALTNY
jgi:tetratricopeptide (TPR) repeat protein